MNMESKVSKDLFESMYKELFDMKSDKMELMNLKDLISIKSDKSEVDSVHSNIKNLR